jgi:hypothetical protein
LGSKGFSDLSVFIDDSEVESGVDWVIYLPYAETPTPTPTPSETPTNDNNGFEIVEKPID